MKPTTLLLAAALLAPCTIALADDFPTPAPVVAVTVHPSGGILTRRATLDIPEGQHRILLRTEFAQSGMLPTFRATPGLRVNAVAFLQDGIVRPELYRTLAQTALVDRVETLEEALIEARTGERAILNDIAGTEAQLDFLGAIRPPTEGPVDLAALAELSRQIGDQTRTARHELSELNEALRRARQELEDLTGELAQAKAELDAAGMPQAGDDIIALDVTATGAPATLEIDEMSGDMQWSFDYEVTLHRGEDARIDIARNVLLGQSTGFDWQDVAITLATDRLNRRLAPSRVRPDRRMIHEQAKAAPESLSRLGGVVESDMMVMEEVPMVMEEPAIELAAPSAGTMVVNGQSVKYVFPRGITMRPYEGASLALDTLSFNVEEFILATPRRAKNAFLMGEFTNDSGAPILSASARFIRDGQLVGSNQLPAIGPGEVATLGFGVFEGIAVTHNIDRNQTGDRGLIRSTNTQAQKVSFSVENRTGEAHSVLARYPLPFSEQEDLKIFVSAEPGPDATDFEGRRGVSEWNLEIAPGEEATVNLDYRFTWPEDWVPDW